MNRKIIHNINENKKNKKRIYSTLVVRSPVIVWVIVSPDAVYVMVCVALNLSPTTPILLQPNVKSAVAPSVKITESVAPVIFAVHVGVPTGLIEYPVRLMDFPNPFLSCITTLLVVALNSPHANPGPIVHELGRNLPGFNTPKYANAPMATKTTNIAQP